MVLSMNPLENSELELASLMEKRAELDRKIESVRQAIEVLEPVYRATPTTHEDATIWQIVQDIDDIQNVGITEAIKKVLMAHPDVLFAPTTVRDALAAAKFTIKGDNPMASVHQVLKRLTARDNTHFFAVETNGQTAYKYSRLRRGLLGIRLIDKEEPPLPGSPRSLAGEK